MILVLLGLAHVSRQWQSDLVERRRSIRMTITWESGLFILFALINAFLYPHMQLPLWLVLFNQLCMGSIALYLAYGLLLAQPKSLDETCGRTPDLIKRDALADTKALSYIEQNWLDKLTYAMEQDLLYKRKDLTIRVLAQELKITEHQF